MVRYDIKQGLGWHLHSVDWLNSRKEKLYSAPEVGATEVMSKHGDARLHLPVLIFLVTTLGFTVKVASGIYVIAFNTILAVIYHTLYYRQASTVIAIMSQMMASQYAISRITHAQEMCAMLIGSF